ncbi:MAG: hypothetical protein C4581_04680 [Nitrospiraceae bacterium]|nr:MAG: hypothetical protein C4581_04680 [Nitrospiraceae bacterium]
MKKYRNNFKNISSAWIYILMIIIAAVAASLAVDNIKLSTDSLRYGLISQQILSGNGIRIPAIRLEDNYIPVSGAIPYLEQPPLLPILLALLGSVTPDSFFPAQLLNMVCHIVSTVFTFLIMVKLYDNKIIGLLTGTLVSFSYPMLKLTQNIISEPLFIALTVAAVYFLVLLRTSNQFQFGRLIVVASFFATASIMTRWAGVSLIGLFLVEFLILVKNKRPEAMKLSTYIAIAMPIVATIALFTRNYIISGTIRGINQPSPGRTYINAITGTIRMIFEQFQLGTYAIILIALLLTAFIILVLVRVNLRKESLKLFNSGLGSIIFFMLTYITLIIITMAEKQAQFEVRYVSPLVPFLFVCLILITVLIWKEIEFKAFSKLSLIGTTLSLSIIVSGNFYKTFVHIPDFSYKQEKVYSILNSCTFKWVKDNYDITRLITTNKPYHLSFFGGYSTIITPHSKFDWNIKVPVGMESLLPIRMNKIGSQVLVLFEPVEEPYDGSYLANLFVKRETDDTFTLAHKCADGAVYILRGYQPDTD